MTTKAGDLRLSHHNKLLEKSKGNFDAASGSTLLNSPKSDDGEIYESPVKNGVTQQHSTPVVNQNRLVSSHRNSMRNNVAQFIQDHSIGKRIGQGRAIGQNNNRGEASQTTGVETMNPHSDIASWNNGRQNIA